MEARTRSTLLSVRAIVEFYLDPVAPRLEGVITKLREHAAAEARVWEQLERVGEMEERKPTSGDKTGPEKMMEVEVEEVVKERVEVERWKAERDTWRGAFETMSAEAERLARKNTELQEEVTKAVNWQGALTQGLRDLERERAELIVQVDRLLNRPLVGSGTPAAGGLVGSGTPAAGGNVAHDKKRSESCTIPRG